MQPRRGRSCALKLQLGIDEDAEDRRACLGVCPKYRRQPRILAPAGAPASRSSARSNVMRAVRVQAEHRVAVGVIGRRRACVACAFTGAVANGVPSMAGGGGHTLDLRPFEDRTGLCHRRRHQESLHHPRNAAPHGRIGWFLRLQVAAFVG